MKKLIIFFGIVLLMIISYISVSVFYINRDVDYYGVISDNNRVNKLVSEEKDVVYNYHLPDDEEKLKKGEWIKITFTENRGTIVKQEVINISDVPSNIINKYKSLK
ncbi:DUF4889 domain-containing protein [Mammaliicoccus sciuri]|uniref:DUF4889 domain-containing protein n=1 Tax=Mammaliicoccus sciuri TaxID=1296 RepID=UPI001FB2B2BF|nr:DUF4889 domain-containing protein [Mammaliicoccus sciuri]MCJ0951540.1 DUF4889 domain-containing protein [Mammaliicoccus sciuri]